MGRKKIPKHEIGFAVQRIKAAELIDSYGHDAVHHVKTGTPIEKALIVELRNRKLNINRVDEMKTNTEHRRRETDRVDQVCMKYQLEKAAARIAELEDANLCLLKVLTALRDEVKAVNRPRTNLPDEWRLKSVGQVKAGDRISFDLGGNRICVIAKEVLNPGTDREEVIYNRKKNFYFITSMALDGTSTHKNVFILSAADGKE